MRISTGMSLAWGIGGILVGLGYLPVPDIKGLTIMTLLGLGSLSMMISRIEDKLEKK